MSEHRDDDQLNQEEAFSLEDILAEFGMEAPPEAQEGPESPAPRAQSPEIPQAPKPSGAQEGRRVLAGPSPDREPATPGRRVLGEAPSAGPAKAPSAGPAKEEKPAPDWEGKTIPFRIPSREEKKTGLKGRKEAVPSGGGVVTAFPGSKQPRPAPEEGAEDLPPVMEELPQEEGEAAKVLEFPGQEPENPVAAGIDKLRRKADDFAEHMYEGEDPKAKAAARKAERLIPGVDEEEPPDPRERKPRKEARPAPDLPAAELAKRYGRGLKGARVRLYLCALPVLALFYLMLAGQLGLPLPGALAGDPALQCYVLAGCQALALLLGIDGALQALAGVFRFRIGLDTVCVLANLATLADALSLPYLSSGGWVRQPLCAAAALSFWCVLWGNLQKRRGQRLACRTAAAASEPYLVTRDEGKWNNRDTYAKWSGHLVGFGSQIQGLDGAQRIYRIAAPLLLLACLLFSLIASLGRQRPEDILWCLSATLTAASALSATLCFGRPWRKLSMRLSKSGAALAGWEGVVGTTGAANVLLSDTDLFPPGAVALNGVKVFGDWPVEKVVALTATVIRDGGSGLGKLFHDLLRSQGAIYRRGEKLTAYEGGGLSEVIRGEQVLVGSASFMVLMDVSLPPGHSVKNAVFCAIDGELAGIFALNYHLSGAASVAVDSLIRNRLTPVLATRDFNLIPEMLRQRFKLPVERMEFPPVERRRELSDPDQEHSDTLTAVLCREGVGPYAEAVVGGRRLRSAVRLSAALACIGSAVGVLLAFYLTFVAAYASLTAVNLTIFLLMWLVPTPLITGWVDRY